MRVYRKVWCTSQAHLIISDVLADFGWVEGDLERNLHGIITHVPCDKQVTSK